MAALFRASDQIGSFSGGFAVFCLVALLVLILVQVGMGLLGKVLPAMAGGLSFAWEYSAYLMGAAFMFGAAAGVRAGSHVRVTILLAQAGTAATRILEVAATSVGLGVTGFMAWSLIRFTMRAWTLGQLSSGSLTPLWIPDAALAAGAVLLGLQMLARLLRILLDQPPEDESLKTGGVAE